MASVYYYLRSKVPGRLSKIYLRFTVGREANFRIPTEFLVLTEAWAGGSIINPDEPVIRVDGEKKPQRKDPSVEKIRNSACNDIFTKQDAHKLLNSLGNLRMHILNNYRPGMTVTKEWLTNLVHLFHHPEDNTPKPPEDFNLFVKRYIDEAESGHRLTTKGQHFSKDTVKSLKSWKMNWDKFQEVKGKSLNFEDVNLDLYKEILRYFNELGFKMNSTGKFIKALKTFMQAAKEEGLHSNVEYLRKAFKAIHNDVYTVFLTDNEVARLYDLKLDNEGQRLYRDVFLVGVYTAQRFSDYHRISHGNVVKLNNGSLAIELSQKKTDTPVQIPCRPELIEILKRYDYKLPKTHEQYVNAEIKGICRQAKITDLVEISENIGGKISKRTIEKCTLITTHTARRTGATLMYLSGIPSISIMKITGHKTEKEFLKYIRLDSKGNAEVLSGHEYFNPKPKLRVV